MTDPGYVYLLMNASMQGMVKIGRTQRDPDERARELSAATGVPTPFILVFQAYFADCIRAEQYVHTLLESKSYRVTSNREFFVVPVPEAVRAIQQAERVLGSTMIPLEDSLLSTVGDVDVLGEEPWRAILDLADAAREGSGDTLQDEEEALRLYDKAAKLGSADACLQAGRICFSSDTLRDTKRALSYLKEGARLGQALCHVEMAKIFAADQHIPNWRVCWNAYFASDIFLAAGSQENILRALLVIQYLREARDLGVPLDHHGPVMTIKHEVLAYAASLVARAKDRKDESTAFYEIDYHYVRGICGEGHTLTSQHGVVKWYDAKKGYGFITLDDGTEVFFLAIYVVTREAFRQDDARGLSVHCRVVAGGSRGPVGFDVRVP
jgi:cold shock CspA family protein